MKIHHFIILILLISNCGQESTDGFGYAKGEAAFSEEVYEELLEVPATEQPQSSETGLSEVITKKLIKSGGVEFESKSIEEDYRKIKALLPKFDGFIENERQHNTSQRISYNLTIRIPADNYDTVFNSISGLASRLENKYSNVEDVTSRYYDLKSRIKNKKALEKRYVELLTKANTITEILEIERNINQVRTEIERLEGQFKYLSKQVSFSTIQLTFYEILPYSSQSSGRRTFGARIFKALDNGWQGFLSFLVGLTTLWPFITLLILSIWGIRKLRRRWKEKKNNN